MGSLSELETTPSPTNEAVPCTSGGPKLRSTRDGILARYGGQVEIKHPNSLWRRDLVYERRGLRLEVRPMTPDDDLRETDFFNAQSVRERLMRFMGVKNKLAPAEVRQLTHLDFHRDFALVAVDRETDALAGVARYCRDREESTTAEAAVAVLQCYQRLGLARYLLSVLFDAAKEYGVKTLMADILRENTASRALFEKVAHEVDAQMRLVEADYEVFTFECTLPALADASNPQETSAPPSNCESDARATPSYTVDDSRHPRSLWRHDLVYDTGMRIELRPADPDDKVRVRNFAKSLADAETSSAIRDLEHVDFTSGFNLVAIDASKDELVGAAHFHRSQDCSRLNVLTAPEYRGLGISDFMAAEVMRAAEKEVVLPAKRALL